MFEMKYDAIAKIFPPNEECYGFVGYLDHDVLK